MMMLFSGAVKHAKSVPSEKAVDARLWWHYASRVMEKTTQEQVLSDWKKAEEERKNPFFFRDVLSGNEEAESAFFCSFFDAEFVVLMGDETDFFRYWNVSPFVVEKFLKEQLVEFSDVAMNKMKKNYCHLHLVR